MPQTRWPEVTQGDYVTMSTRRWALSLYGIPRLAILPVDDPGPDSDSEAWSDTEGWLPTCGPPTGHSSALSWVGWSESRGFGLHAGERLSRRANGTFTQD